MPRSRTRRGSRSPPKNRGTRRASPKNALVADPLIEAMIRGELLWGDLLYEPSPARGSRSRSRSRSRSPRMPRAPPASPASPPRPVMSPINDVFEGYRTPDLRLREFIHEKFPVVLEEIRSANGREMYAVSWDRPTLEAWRSERTETWEEAMEYELFSELRLLHSLRKHAHLYKLHEPRSKDEIVVIEMIGAPAYRGPVLRKLNDITTHFPGVVVWAKVEGRKGESTYALTVRGDFARRAGKGAARTLGQLEEALRASRFWNVLAPQRGEFLRLEMRHD